MNITEAALDLVNKSTFWMHRHNHWNLPNNGSDCMNGGEYNLHSYSIYKITDGLLHAMRGSKDQYKAAILSCQWD